MRILLIEDNERLARTLVQGLSEEGVIVAHAPTAARALEQTRANARDALVRRAAGEAAGADGRASGPRWATVTEGEVTLDDELGVRHGETRVS